MTFERRACQRKRGKTSTCGDAIIEMKQILVKTLYKKLINIFPVAPDARTQHRICVAVQQVGDRYNFDCPRLHTAARLGVMSEMGVLAHDQIPEVL